MMDGQFRGLDAVGRSRLSKNLLGLVLCQVVVLFIFLLTQILFEVITYNVFGCRGVIYVLGVLEDVQF
jgi:hypothetical protein